VTARRVFGERHGHLVLHSQFGLHTVSAAGLLID
jgi:hypothetical protein